ncbi:MAG: penicillin-binding transpeptidase domain-containing protein, partial [Planctomycetota bacterium]
MLRLAQMQLLTASSVQNEIAALKQQRGQTRQLKTIRGRILDRNGRELAVDEARFWIHINYKLSSFLDERVQKAMLDEAAARRDADVAEARVYEQIREKLEDLQLIIEKCSQFKKVEPNVIWNEIEKINDYVWSQRMFQAWRKNFPNSEVSQRYENPISIPHSAAIADFIAKQPDQDIRDKLASKIDILEMHENWPLLELKTDDDVFAAQLEFMDTEGLYILPKSHRFYPYRTVAAHTIGWVGLATQPKDKELFEGDELLSYLEGELCGREDGVEYVCETILRGRRGKLSHDIDGQLTSRTDTEFGDDVKLTLDIELQQRIENYLTKYPHEPNCGPGMSAVVIEVGTSDILALVSLPVYDLNRVRYDYGDLDADKENKPLINRAINAQYPPGSVVKPLILIAGLETGQITPEDIINCPSEAAPEGWPDCLIFRRSGAGHDNRWENTARNAIKGSCNIYFSRLADMIEPEVLQQWLYKFGYGHDALFLPDSLIDKAKTGIVRNFKQGSGIISITIPREKVLDFNDIVPLRPVHRKMFGIGQGSLRVTPLQVANSIAAIARGGILKRPRLLQESGNSEGIDLGISLETLAVV